MKRAWFVLLLGLPGCLLFSGVLDGRCGNHRVDLDFGEACDDGNNVDADGCEADCSNPACQNGIRDVEEICFLNPVAAQSGGGADDLTLVDLDGDQALDLLSIDRDIQNNKFLSVSLNDNA